jgi:hypothetical protein
MNERAYIHGPDKAEVIALRLRVQDAYGIGVMAAQDKLSAVVGAKGRGTWAQWESGIRRMHPGLWMLAQLRTNTHPRWMLVALPPRQPPPTVASSDNLRVSPPKTP